MRTLLVGLFLATVLPGMPCPAQGTQVVDVSVGKPPPEFRATDSEGREHRLSQYRGRYVVLEWLNPRCPFVDKHYGSDNMQTLQREAVAGGMAWLSVASSAPGHPGYLDRDRSRRFLNKTGAAPTAIFLDPDGRLGRLYDADKTPQVYIIDPDGILVYIGGMDDKPTTRWIDVDDAVDYVGEALDDIFAGRPIARPITAPYGCPVEY
jgi:hypothetical protein